MSDIVPPEVKYSTLRFQDAQGGTARQLRCPVWERLRGRLGQAARAVWVADSLAADYRRG